jgi:hypothetical protein
MKKPPGQKVNPRETRHLIQVCISCLRQQKQTRRE